MWPPEAFCDALQAAASGGGFGYGGCGGHGGGAGWAGVFGGLFVELLFWAVSFCVSQRRCCTPLVYLSPS